MPQVILYGSMRKHYDEFLRAGKAFESAGMKVIAPQLSEILKNDNGFVYCEGDDLSLSPQQIEADFLAKSASLDPHKDFAYVINPEGYIGKSCTAELMHLLSLQKRVFAMNEIDDPPLILPDNYVFSPEELVNTIKKFGHYPLLGSTSTFAQYWKSIIPPLSAVGGIVENLSSKDYRFGFTREKEVWFIQKKSWWDQYTLIGGTKLPGETDEMRIKKELEEQLGIKNFKLGQLLLSFAEAQNAWYWNSAIFREFKDYIITVKSASQGDGILWLPPTIALQELDLELNARKTLEYYKKQRWLSA